MKKLFCVFCALILVLTVVNVQAQSFSEKLVKMDKYPGYFTFYWDASTGKIFLEIDKLDVEFLYVNSLSAGLGSNDIGLDRSQLGGTQVVKFHRIGPKFCLSGRISLSVLIAIVPPRGRRSMTVSRVRLSGDSRLPKSQGGVYMWMPATFSCRMPIM